MKKNLTIIGVALIILTLFMGEKMTKDEIQVRTDTEPIYNYFPSFPKTEIMEWHGTSSTGIGPATIELYVFAFYNCDIEQILGIDFEEKTNSINPPFLPDALNGQYEGWNKVKGNFLFQDEIYEFERMYTTVYVNTNCNIIYMEAIGD